MGFGGADGGDPEEAVGARGSPAGGAAEGDASATVREGSQGGGVAEGEGGGGEEANCTVEDPDAGGEDDDDEGVG